MASAAPNLGSMSRVARVLDINTGTAGYRIQDAWILDVNTGIGVYRVRGDRIVDQRGHGSFTESRIWNSGRLELHRKKIDRERNVGPCQSSIVRAVMFQRFAASRASFDPIPSS
jgi:hypothetical protein